MIVLFILLLMCAIMVGLGYYTYTVTTPSGVGPTTTPVYRFEMVDDEPVLTQIEPSDCTGDVYTKKTSCSRNGTILDGTVNNCGAGKEEWILDPDASGFQPAIGTGSCPVQYRDCEVICDTPCRGATWIEGACIRDGVVLDGSETDKCGRGMRTYTLDESASDYVASTGRGVCTKTYSSACDVECPQNVVAPPACVYSSTWQKSANGCVVSKEDRANPVGYDEDGWQESFKLALEAENCTGEKRLSEWETCKGPPAPVNCEGTWGPNDGWGPCIGSCGTQPSQSRTYSVTTKALNGGAACPYEDGKVETKSCGSVVTCPVDCEGRWIDVTCPTACGVGESKVSKTWYTSTQPQGTGKACPAPDDPEGQKACPATPSCPWVQIGGCTPDGKQYYTRNVVNNGDATTKTEDCCYTSPWSAWGACQSNGRQTATRSVTSACTGADSVSSKEQTCCYEGNEWRNITCNPNNSTVQRKTLVNCPQAYAQRTVPGGCNYQKCSVQTWKHGNFTSHTWKINDTLPNVSSTGSRHDEISSYAKYGNCRATAYEHPNYGGWAYTLQEGRHGVPGWVNDRISSIKIEHLPYNL